jgi:hypothetical protein
MPWTPRLFPLASFILVATSSPALAVPIDGRTELQLQTSLMSLSSIEVRTEQQSAGEGTTTTQSDVGFTPRLGFGLGHGFGDHLLLHLLAGVTSTQRSVDPGGLTMDQVSYEIGPSVRFVAKGERARFFVGAGFSLGGAKLSGDSVQKSSAFNYAVGPVVGMHGFLNDYVSLDPAFELSWVGSSLSYWGAQSFNDSSTGQTPSRTREVELAGSGFRILATLSLTGWLGAPKPVTAAVQPSQPARFIIVGAEPPAVVPPPQPAPVSVPPTPAPAEPAPVQPAPVVPVAPEVAPVVPVAPEVAPVPPAPPPGADTQAQPPSSGPAP